MRPDLAKDATFEVRRNKRDIWVYDHEVISFLFFSFQKVKFISFADEKWIRADGVTFSGVLRTKLHKQN